MNQCSIASAYPRQLQTNRFASESGLKFSTYRDVFDPSRLLQMFNLCSHVPTSLSLPLQSLATWESENKIHCKQTLVEGEGPKTFWTRELNGDELTLVRTWQ